MTSSKLLLTSDSVSHLGNGAGQSKDFKGCRDDEPSWWTWRSVHLGRNIPRYPVIKTLPFYWRGCGFYPTCYVVWPKNLQIWKRKEELACKHSGSVTCYSHPYLQRIKSAPSACPTLPIPLGLQMEALEKSRPKLRVPWGRFSQAQALWSLFLYHCFMGSPQKLKSDWRYGKIIYITYIPSSVCWVFYVNFKILKLSDNYSLIWLQSYFRECLVLFKNFDGLGLFK